MPIPRKRQISLDSTPFYHCLSRCVRKAFLCGFDSSTNRSYEHRRQQLEENAIRLASLFFVDIAAMAVMSNHYHLVLHVNQQSCLKATPKSIITRWHELFSGTEVSKKYLNDEPLETHEREQLNTLIDTWRSRLHNISWYMRVLNETTARSANKEDDCTGHFWESRFKCQALLDEQAVLSCMSYVDLNPIRAAMATTPEDSDHTSIKRRIQHWKEKSKKPIDSDQSPEDFQPNELMPFAGNPRQPMPEGIPFNVLDYLELLDWTGRQIRDDKRGSIDESTPPVLDRLAISPKHWVYLCTHFESRFKGLVGSAHTLSEKCGAFGRKRRPNFSNSKLLFR